MDTLYGHKPVVYFAGKIEKNGWRNEIVGELPGLDDAYDHPERLFDPTVTIDAGKFLYGGPFFVRCDHGCSHGRGLHAAADGACSGAPLDVHHMRTRIWEANCARITRADAVFAYVDETDCYGTLIEIGFAAALEVPLHIAFGRSLRIEDFDDMWMARAPGHPQPWYGNVGSPRETFDGFLQHLLPVRGSSAKVRLLKK